MASVFSPHGVFSISSLCCGDMEKNAISLPETNPDRHSAKTAHRSAMISGAPKEVGMLTVTKLSSVARGSMVGKGSKSKVV